MDYSIYQGGAGNQAFGLAAGGLATFILLALILWEAVWKGIAMWHAARRGQKGWYITILVLNTLGILPIIYIFAVAKVQRKDAAVPGGADAGG